MKKRRIVDSAKIREAVESGQLDKKIMTGFGLEVSRQKDSDSARKAGRRRKARGRPALKQDKFDLKIREISVNVRGSLIVPKELITEFGIDIGEKFSMQKTKVGISLKKI